MLHPQNRQIIKRSKSKLSSSQKVTKRFLFSHFFLEGKAPEPRLFRDEILRIDQLYVKTTVRPLFSNCQQCAVMYWGVEGGTARGTTALVYLQLHSSLYKGTVHVLSSVVGVHPPGLTAD
jgi:hypothetical protein